MKERNDVIMIITEGKSERNENGFSKKVILYRKEIFASESSAKRSEYYAALRDGHRVICVMTVLTDDYNDAVVKDGNKKIFPQKVIYDGAEYHILRTYKTDFLHMELTLEEVE